MAADKRPSDGSFEDELLSGEKAEEGSKKKRALKAAAKTAVRAMTAKGRKELIRKLVEAALKRLAEEPGKTSASDVIRLLSLEKELEKEQPTKITVEWIDPRTGKPWEPS